ncbi:hypothetical protein FRX31_016392 [Thalictrum thalictroides]|uniref:Bulb-type lectin domain-containing protein n=1 Tax=Thalictrum thalictroides TaxID=46969 RepID=A0A7J6WCT9_THATH|nr:hypothetical protein FRX31_016392 [Thalictrum thalictroides]
MFALLCGGKQSSSYLTDTILQGQTLKSGESLVPNTGNSNYRLVMQTDGNLELIDDEDEYYLFRRRTSIIRWESETGKKGGGIVINLDSTGCMYLVDKDGIVIKNLTKEEKQNQRSTATDIIYRATLESDGFFRLYGENIR